TEAGPRELVRRNGACRRTRCAADWPLPFTGALELLDSADDQIPFDPTQAIDEQLAVEMIHLVLERSCEEAGRVVLFLSSLSSQPLDDGTSGAYHRCVESRDAQTALFFQLHSVAFDELRIDEHQQSRRVAPGRHVDDEDARGNTDLRRGQADAGGRVHRVDHVIDGALNLECDRVDRCRWLVEETVAVLEDGSDHAGSGVDTNRRASAFNVVPNHFLAKRAVVRAQKARWFSVSSWMESPPNLSNKASASTRAIIASPTTAAAGTAHTSLRSMVAGLSAIVVRSTERRGFISVAMGFMSPDPPGSPPWVTPASKPPALFVGRITPTTVWRPFEGRISSCSLEPGREAATGPRPMPTPLIPGMKQRV